MEIILEHSFLWIIAIVLIALLLSLLLYRRDQKNDLSLSWRFSLGSIRFLIFVFLGLLLLSPLIKNRIKEVRKASVLIAVDNSLSMVGTKDSILVKEQIAKTLQGLEQALGEDYELGVYTFGTSFNAQKNFTYKENASDLSRAVEGIWQENRHRNVGAMILLSDGIYNKGFNPIYAAEKLSYPIYTMGFGDTSQYRDVAINRFLSNDIAFLDDFVPVVVDVKSTDLQGERLKVSLFLNDKKMDQKELVVQEKNALTSLEFSVKMPQVGIQKLRVQVESVRGELNTKNNTAVFYVEVLDARQKILLAYKNPHPDVGALRKIILSSDNYELEVKNQNEVADLSNYNLLILHGIPDNNRVFSRIQNQIREDDVSVFYIYTQGDLPAFINQLSPGYTLQQKGMSYDEVTPKLNQAYEGFNVSKDFERLAQSFSPLNVLHGKVQLMEGSETVLFQQIGAVETNYPLLLLNTNQQANKAALLGEGLWRWRMIAYQEKQDFSVLNDFFLNVIRATSLKVKKERFKVQSKKLYDPGEAVLFRASLYNASYQLINEPELNINVKNQSSGESYDYSFNRGEKNYHLDMGILPPGTYSWKANVSLDNEPLSKQGVFTVQNSNLELLALQANHDLLRKMAMSSGGSYIPNASVQTLTRKLQEQEGLMSTEHQFLRFISFIQLKYLLAILVLLISLEWFLRKYLGLY